jgi:hypothetical protein
MRRAALGLLALALLVSGAILARRLRPDPPKTADELLADSIGVLRTAAEDCRAALDEGTVRLHAYDAQLDSMRARVRAFEAMDARGVPADSYEVYLDAFEQYNDSAAGWTARTDTLRARLQRCRDVTESHNLLSDSLRRLLIQRRPEATRP